jgi:ferredoxin
MTKAKTPPNEKGNSKGKERKSFQDLQDEKKQARELEELMQTQIDLQLGFLMGASCESRICSACEVIVEEFGDSLF